MLGRVDSLLGALPQQRSLWSDDGVMDMAGADGDPSVAALEAELDSILGRLRRLERDMAQQTRSGGREQGSGVQGLAARLESIRRVCAGLRRAVTRSAGRGEKDPPEERVEDSPPTSFRRERDARSGLRAKSGFGLRARPKNPARAEARAQLQGALDSIAKSRQEATDKRLAWALGVLGGRPGSSSDELRQSYRAMLRKTHPDVSQHNTGAPSAGGGPSFAEVQQAWDVVRDEGLAQ